MLKLSIFLRQTTEGVAQGGSLSPLLANIYLNYTLDLWFTKVVAKRCKGGCYLTKYADDSVACFQYEEDAKTYHEALKRRLAKFEFLGFTHYCSKSRKGNFKLKWKTSSKKFRAKVNDFNKWIKENRNFPIGLIWKKVNQKLRGHYWLKRRSQRTKLNWDTMVKLLEHYPLVNPIPYSSVNLNPTYV